MLCERNGVAYQVTHNRVSYDAAYLEKFEAYDAVIAGAVNAGRCAMLGRHLAPGARVLDFGAGDGAFVRMARSCGFDVMGFEVIPESAAFLRAAGLYADDPTGFDAVCLWDVIEHMEDPGELLRKVGGRLFVSLPIFDDLSHIRESRHYRPGEHLTHWTEQGFVNWMALQGFSLLERSTHETDAGRDSIGAFAFVRA